MFQDCTGDSCWALFNAIPHGVVVIDADGIVVEANEAAARILGVALDDLIGCDASRARWPAWAEDGSELPWEKQPPQIALATGEPVRDYLLSFKRAADGALRRVRVNAEPIFDDAGRPVATVSAIIDITENWENEEQLEQHQEHLQAILASSPLPIITVDLDGNVTSWSTAAENLFGWTTDEAIGQFNPAIPPEKREEFRGILTGLARGTGPEVVETEALLADGSRIAVEMSIAPLLDARGEMRGAVAILRDITESKQAEQRLLESRARYRSLFENSPTAMWEQDYSALKSTLEMIDAGTVQEYADYFERRPDVLEQCICDIHTTAANQAALTMLNASSLEELRSRYPDILTPETVRAFGQGIALMASGWTVFDLNMPLRRLNGDVLQAMMRIQVMPGHEESLNQVVISAMDVSELEQAREQLVQTNRMLAAIVGSMEQAVVVTDAHRRIISCNDATTRISGHTDLLGRSTRVFYRSDEDYERFGMQMIPVLSEGKTFETETTLVRADGSEFLAHITTTPLDPSSGFLGGAVSVVEDVSERRELEEHLARTHRLEAIGRLAGGIAHDLNNMLTVIIGNLSMALRNIGDTEAVREQVRQSLEAAQRTSKLIQQLLAFSGRQLLTPEVVDLNEQVGLLQQFLAGVLPENTELQMRLNATRKVFFDPAQVDQIVMDLVVHARDAMPSGGTLTIETADVELSEREARPLDMEPGPYVRLSVIDTGSGMDAETLERVFEPFFRSVRSDAGLGLATTYGSVRQGGGGIEVSSAPDRGSRFDVYLPVAKEALGHSRAGKPKPPPVSIGVTVLVAEDDPAVRRLVVSTLQSRGFHVLPCSTGAEARRLFAANEEAVRVLITDVVMSGMSGTELARRLRERRPDLPVLYISGYAGDVVNGQALRETGGYLLKKPFSPDELVRTVEELLAEAADRGEGAPTPRESDEGAHA